MSGSEDNKNWNALEPEIKCSSPVLTDPNWHLAKTSPRVRTDFCASFQYGAILWISPHTAASTDVAMAKNP